MLGSQRVLELLHLLPEVLLHKISLFCSGLQPLLQFRVNQAISGLHLPSVSPKEVNMLPGTHAYLGDVVCHSHAFLHRSKLASCLNVLLSSLGICCFCPPYCGVCSSVGLLELILQHTNLAPGCHQLLLNVCLGATCQAGCAVQLRLCGFEGCRLACQVSLVALQLLLQGKVLELDWDLTGNV